MKMLIITAIFCAPSLFGADKDINDQVIQEMNSVIAARAHSNNSIELSEIPALRRSTQQTPSPTMRRKTPPHTPQKIPSKENLNIGDIEAAVSARELLFSHISCGDTASLKHLLSSRNDLSVDPSHLKAAKDYQQNAWEGARDNVVVQLYALMNIGVCTTTLILDNQLFNALGNLKSTITSIFPNQSTRALHIQATPTSIVPPVGVPIPTVPDILNIPTATPILNIPSALPLSPLPTVPDVLNSPIATPALNIPNAVPTVGVPPLPTVPDVLNTPAVTSLPATLSSITPSLVPQIAAASGILAGVSYFTYASKSLYSNVKTYFKYRSIVSSLEQYGRSNLSSSKDKVE